MKYREFHLDVSRNKQNFKDSTSKNTAVEDIFAQIAHNINWFISPLNYTTQFSNYVWYYCTIWRKGEIMNSWKI